MTRRWRIFWGAWAIMLWLILSVVLAAALMARLPPWPMAAQLLIALGLGLVWALPLKPLFKWMGRGPTPDS